ncbi:hypothetical protein BO70DRAFT_415768 [Aspergillus heteromorphus CBS 117.55]|uniref:Uncharacterized protein n=1 Tax=Aspergillus heteromorphus CBS 117.55 TaxID=1448321 RepID=A0A317WV27_9EURO|nr:uncharacterized protein BO70DRAFT_415768 [Aspergillus heteromorphus CBS 117.55]PWY90213.1 hypothetical protein BO70DRAFT_415768 [Aspergillus heteromorphus CBS 117.55]
MSESLAKLESKLEDEGSFLEAGQVQKRNLLEGVPWDHHVLHCSASRDIQPDGTVAPQHFAWSTLRRLEALMAAMRRQTYPRNCNQFIVIEGLTAHDKSLLASNLLPGDCRVMYEGTTGLVKVLSTASQVIAPKLFLQEILRQPLHHGCANAAAGRALSDAAFQPTADSVKHPDLCWYPASRISHGHPVPGQWPTLVIEAGLEGCRKKLQHEVRWWFAHSRGGVRTVLLLLVDEPTQDLHVEQWQLAQPDAQGPRVPEADRFHALAAMPPLARQSPLDQKPYCARRITIGKTRAYGEPLRFYTQALFDVDPMMCGLPPDFVVDRQDLVDCVKRVFGREVEE